MVQNCCVTNCKNVWKRDSSIAYHTFPIKDKKRLAKWMQRDELKNVNVTAGKRICSVHFTPESFEEHCAVKRLKRNAVPTLFGKTVQMIDDSPTEIIEIWEEVYTDSVPEKTIVPSDKLMKFSNDKLTALALHHEKNIKKYRNKYASQEETIMHHVIEIKQVGQEPSVDYEIVQEVGQEEHEIEKGEQKKEQEEEQEIEEIFQTNIEEIEEHNLPTKNIIETKDASVQTISAYYEYREEIWELRKKLSMLRQQLKQREASITSTREYIHILISSKD